MVLSNADRQLIDPQIFAIDSDNVVCLADDLRKYLRPPTTNHTLPFPHPDIILCATPFLNSPKEKANNSSVISSICAIDLHSDQAL